MIASSMAFLVSVFASREWQDQWFFFSAFALILMCNTFITFRFGKIATTFIAYVFVSGIYTWLFRHNRYLTLDPYDQQAIRFFAADSVAKLMLVLVPVVYMAKNRRELMQVGNISALAVVLLNCGNVFYQAIKWFFVYGGVCRLENTCGGFLGNPSMSMSFTVCLLPVVMKECTKGGKIFMASIVAIAVLLSKSSVALGVLSILFLFQAISWCWPFIFLAPAVLAIGMKTLGSDFLSSGLRFEMWSLFMKIWANNPANWLWGMGYGTFGVFSRNIQHDIDDPVNGPIVKKLFGLSESISGHEANWWVWLHNDWLEIVFVLGAVGMVLALATYASSICGYYRRKEWAPMQSLLLFGVMMGANYPFHISIPCLFGAWLVACGLIKSNDEHNQV